MTNSARSIRQALSLVLALLAPLAARADGLPPWETACYGKTAGAECTGGLCQASKCSRIDYKSWDQDASDSPPSIKVDCVLCVDAGAAAPAPPAELRDAATTDASAGDAAAEAAVADAAPTPATGPAPAPTPSPTPAPAMTTNMPAPSSASDEPPEQEGGCSLSYRGLAHDLGPWLLAGSVALLLRRRKRER